MYFLITDVQFNAIALVLVAAIGIVPATLAAMWSRTAKTNSAEAVQNSAAAQESAAVTAREVGTNGGMTDPHPNLNDHVKYQTQMLEGLSARLSGVEVLLSDHLKHSTIMDRALSEVYLMVKPEGPQEDPDQN